MQNYYQFIIPRLNGAEVKKKLPDLLALVRKGIAGFIIFGGELEPVRKAVAQLQDAAKLPLIISSDLERGLGQQLRGGTLFPSAMALGRAVTKTGKDGKRTFDLSLARLAFRTVAEEARYAGINTIFAPVLDINTNPKNPIICTRAFGEDREIVSALGCEMIRAFQKAGIAACGKHFPGHGDTETDSHIGLPVIGRSLASLRSTELAPFRAAAECGVKMMMLGHLSVPALDATGIPVSLSGKAVGYLKKRIGYDGILITDAMNMGGIGTIPEVEASLAALQAGVDIILHPSDTGKLIRFLREKQPVISEERVRTFRAGLPRDNGGKPDFEKNGKLSDLLSKRSITASAEFSIPKEPLLLILNDDPDKKGTVLSAELKRKVPGLTVKTLTPERDSASKALNSDVPLIVAVFSDIRGWKGGASSWLLSRIIGLRDRAQLFVLFGSPYLLDGISDRARVFAYTDTPRAQMAAAEFLAKRQKQ